jgi:hypothetical protein
MALNGEIRSRKMANLQLQTHKFEETKTAYNKVYLYFNKLMIVKRFPPAGLRKMMVN